MPGAGNSHQTINYSCVDDDPYPGISYYRLKQTDYNGEFTYSKLISTLNKTEQIADPQIFPNPTSGLVYVQDVSDKFTQAIISSIDGTFLAVRSIDNQVIDLGRFSAGLYVVTFMAGERRLVYRIAKQ